MPPVKTCTTCLDYAHLRVSARLSAEMDEYIETQIFGKPPRRRRKPWMRNTLRTDSVMQLLGE